VAPPAPDSPPPTAVAPALPPPTAVAPALPPPAPPTPLPCVAWPGAELHADSAVRTAIVARVAHRIAAADIGHILLM
ncbi:MAG TPA: hypothetical protein VKO16_13855, partial [Polyangia bacterium]|nr:hypothetical protein [Polyangia bacterium]